MIVGQHVIGWVCCEESQVPIPRLGGAPTTACGLLDCSLLFYVHLLMETPSPLPLGSQGSRFICYSHSSQELLWDEMTTAADEEEGHLLQLRGTGEFGVWRKGLLAILIPPAWTPSCGRTRSNLTITSWWCEHMRRGVPLGPSEELRKGFATNMLIIFQWI